jgi:MinD superfamily P-loop ATPase
MKQLLILSGKGGTGKTTIAGSFIKLSKAKVYADVDVDAPNLHLITNQESKPEVADYYGFPKAKIDLEKCIRCGICETNCRFDAISNDENGYYVDNFACEGCAVCEYICPAKAINMVDTVTGDLIKYVGKDSIFSTAKLKMGSGNSGKLVSEVKKRMVDSSSSAKFGIIDGSPGIGCPVIASLSGVDIVLIVAEPSISGISDMERIIVTAKGFQPKILVCVNKYDTNMENTQRIEDYCKNNNIEFIGKVPYDKNAVIATNQGKTVVEIDCEAGKAVKELYNKIEKYLYED